MQKLPSFIIPGAMKSGTSSLSHILSQGQEVFIPDSEPAFFSRDDYRAHFLLNRGSITRGNYQDFFQDAEEGQLVGERSTTYLSSKFAPRRISRELGEVKLIFMLRDPVSRAYSNYKHKVRTGKGVSSFENVLKDGRGAVVERGLYKEQIERYKQHFDDDQMMFVIFEEFVEDQQKVVNEVCDFLEIGRIDLEGIDTHRNPSPGFRTLKGQLLANYISEFTGLNTDWFTRLNRSQSKSFPEMDEEVKQALQYLFRRENEGISELIGKDVSEYWDYM